MHRGGYRIRRGTLRVGVMHVFGCVVSESECWYKFIIFVFGLIHFLFFLF